MARQPRPWYRKDRRAWFVTIDGVRHNLGPEKKAPLEKFHQMMGEPRKRIAPSGSLVQIIDGFLKWCQQHRAADTYEWYRFRLQQFAETYPDLTVRELRPYHVQRWLDQMNGLASGFETKLLSGSQADDELGAAAGLRGPQPACISRPIALVALRLIGIT
jgi:hypothetical protein